ncbi:MAG: hypothetical protein AAF840_02655 [Bacteroidota bacterium]
MPNKPDPTEQELIDALRRRARADLKQELQAREAKLEPIAQPQAKVRRFSPRAIAAVLLPLVAVAIWLALSRSPDYPQLVADYTFAYPNVATTPIVRGPEEPTTQTLSEALADYEAGRYPAALAALQALPATDTTAFYQAVIAAEQADWPAVDRQLAKVPTSSTFAIPADYYRALSALAAGDEEGARVLLEPVQKWGGYPGLRRRVEEVLGEI